MEVSHVFAGSLSKCLPGGPGRGDVHPGIPELCKTDPLAYATAAERMLTAIGEPELVDTRRPRLSRIFANKVIKIYPAFRSSTAWRT
jgi:hypothetical protein